MTEPRLQASEPVSLAVLYLSAAEDARNARLVRYDRLVAAGWKPSEALCEVNR